MLEVVPEQTLQDGGSATGGTVRLASGTSVDYDWLVVSLGAAADPRGVPGVKECARPFVTLEDAEYVAHKLSELESRAAVGGPEGTVVIVGAGYAGVELAAVVAERVKGKVRVMLLTPSSEILDGAPPGQREAAVQVSMLWVPLSLLLSYLVTYTNGCSLLSSARQGLSSSCYLCSLVLKLPVLVD